VIASFSDRVEVPKNVLVRIVEKESVFLNLETEGYYGLDETGTRTRRGKWSRRDRASKMLMRSC
jgi:hypothetical protein